MARTKVSSEEKGRGAPTGVSQLGSSTQAHLTMTRHFTGVTTN